MSDIINAFLQIVLLSSIMITILILVKSLFAKRVSPSIMAVLWIMILLRLTVPITIESPIHISSTILPTESILSDNVISNKQDVTTNTNDKPILDNNSVDTYNEEPIKDANNIPSTAKNNDTQISKQVNVINKLKGISLYESVFILWCTGAVFMLLKAIAVTMGFNRKLKKCRAVENPFVLHMVTKQKNKLAIKKTIRIVECNHVDVPMVFGYFRPYLLIPRKYLIRNKNNLYYILLHEMCHIVRHDILKNYLWLFAKVIHWFNPLVYIAYKMYQDNIELCCDQMVVNRLSKDDKYRYSQTLVDVIRMSSRKNPLPVAASLCTSKSVLKERVLMMIQPRKRSMTALVISMVLAVVMLLGGFTTACIPKEVKASDLEAKVKEQPVKAESMPQQQKDNVPQKTINKYSAPEFWQCEMHFTDGKMDILIDSDVIVPIDTWGRYEIMSQGVTQENLDNILNALVGDALIYKKRGLSKSKEELQKVIEEIDKTISKLDPEKDVKYIELYNEQKKIREELIKNTTTDSTKIPLNIKLGMNELIDLEMIDTLRKTGHPAENITGYTSDSDGLVDLGKDIPASIRIYKHNGGVVFSNTGNNEGMTGLAVIDDDRKPIGVTISEDEASQIARKLVYDMGYDYLDICAVHTQQIYDKKRMVDGKMPECYTFSFSRSIDGFPLTFAYWDGNMLDKGMEQFEKSAPNWRTVEMSVSVDDSGVIGVAVKTPKSQMKTLDSGVKLLEFRDIMKVFKENVEVLGSYSGFGNEDNVLNRELHVDEIRLGYMVTVGEEYEGQIVIVPVWDFFGWEKTSFDKDYPHQGDLYASLDKNYQRNFDLKHKAILTINAVDGTIMQREKGSESIRD